MRTKRSTCFILTLVVLFALISCSKTGVSGKYVSEKNPGDYLELKSDGTYFCQESIMGTRMGTAGKYEVDGDQITLKTDMGFASRGKIQGKTIIDPGGQRWTKQ